MTWCRVRLSEEQRQIVHAERVTLDAEDRAALEQRQAVRRRRRRLEVGTRLVSQVVRPGVPEGTAAAERDRRQAGRFQVQIGRTVDQQFVSLASVMPEGLLDKLDKKEIADLFAF